MSRLVAISEDTVTTLASEVRASRRVLAGLLRRHRALRARLDDSASRRPRATAGPVPLSTGKQERYWVQRGAHTRRGTFTALLTPWPGDEGGPGGPGGPGAPGAPGESGALARIKVETALDCWWAWRHPDMAATIAAHRGPVVWLDFLDPTTGQAAAPFPAYAGRYQQARQSFLAAEGEWPGSRSPTRSVQPGTATRAPVTR